MRFLVIEATGLQEYPDEELAINEARKLVKSNHDKTFYITKVTNKVNIEVLITKLDKEQMR